MINVNSVFSIIQAYIRVIVLNSNENNSRDLSLLLKPVNVNKCSFVGGLCSLVFILGFDNAMNLPSKNSFSPGTKNAERQKI